MSLTDEQVRALEKKAEEIRETIIKMLVAAGSGHTAGPLGMADIFTAFYFHILHHDPVAECLTLRKFGTRLQGPPEMLRLEGLETTSGPLGEGLSQAAGMAYSFKNFQKPEPSAYSLKPRIYCLMSDGEQEEGSTWEAAMFAGKYKLSNLTAVMDRNNIQIDGMTEEVMPLEPLADKYRAFNWHVLEVDGHNFTEYINAVEESKAIYEKPTLIIAHTIPGKGVPEIEFDYHWHGKPPTKEEAKRFLKEIRTMAGKVAGEYS